MQRLSWTAIGAAGLVAGASVAGFTMVTAAAGERAVRGIELRDVVDPATGEPRAQWTDGSVDSVTGLPTPRVTITQPATAAPTDSDASVDSSPEVVTKPVVTAKPKATATPKPKATVQPAATDSADSPDSADSSD
jgi:hypothetical protein